MHEGGESLYKVLEIIINVVNEKPFLIILTTVSKACCIARAMGK